MRVVGSLYLDGTTIKMKNSTVNGATNIVAGAVASGADINITLPLWSTTFLATAATSITLPTTGTLATLAGTEALTNKTLTSPKINENVALTTTSTILNLLTSAAGTTGTTSTNIVFSTSPTLVTPVLGAATATTINGLTITTSASGVLTIAASKTLSVSNTLTFTGTDESSVAFGTGGTVAYINVATLSSLTTVGALNAGSITSGFGAIDIGADALTAGTTTVAQLIDSGLTADTVPYANASKQLTSSAVTPTELGYVSGVTSAIQTQMNLKAPIASPTFTGTVAGITNTMVGLGNVDNTSDATKNAASVTLTNKTITDPIIDDGLRLNHETSVTTPASGKLAVFAKNDDKLYMTNSSGITTAVASSGTGEKNYVTNPSAASAVTGWTAVSHMTVARTTTAGDLPREYTTATGIKITATATQTQAITTYVYYDFTLDDIDLNKKLKIEWSQKQTGTYVASDLAVIITTQADRANALHTPITTLIPAADGIFTTSFDSSSTATLSLVIRATTNMADNGGLVISDVVVGPGTITQGAAVSEWINCASLLTVSGFGTSPTITGQYQRVGSSMLLRARVAVTNTAGATTFQINMPTGFTIDTSKLPNASQTIGSCSWTNTSTGLVYNGTAYTVSSTALNLYGAGSTGAWSNTIPAAIGTTIAVTMELIIPIAEWAGNGTVNLGAGAQVEYASNSSANTTTSDTNLFAYGPAGNLIGSIANALERTVQFQYPIQTDDILTLEIYDGVTWLGVNEALPFNTSLVYAVQNTTSYGMGIKASTSSKVIVRFGAYATPTGATYTSAGAAWSGYASFYWRVRKAKASSPVGFGLASSGVSGLINYYQEDDTTLAAVTFQGNLGGSASAGVAIKITRVGRMVTLQIPSFTAVTPTTSSTYLLNNTLIPTWARPSSTRNGFHQAYNNGAYLTAGVGTWNVTSTGEIQIFRDLASTAYTNSAAAGWYHIQVTYSV